MRRSYSLRALALVVGLSGLSACVFSVLPATKPNTEHTTVAPVAQSTPDTPEPHHTTHYYRCKAGFKPLSDEDRPKLGNVDTSDKAKLNVALAAYIQKLDTYMTEHQRKEEKAYRQWRSECDDFLN